MELCLDVGNSHLFGGVFLRGQLKLRFVTQTASSDQIGLFLCGVLRENQINVKDIQRIGVSSVVPRLDYSIRSACVKYFSLEPFVLQAGVKTGLKLKVSHPAEVGADIIACAIAARHHHPSEQLLVVDFGTATTVSVLDRDAGLLGVLIYPGMQTGVEALAGAASKLASVPIIKPDVFFGRDTKSAMQTGLYYSQAAMLSFASTALAKDAFKGEAFRMIATGGFAHLFAEHAALGGLYPDLALEGLYLAMSLNT